ncbi:MAG: hypothetical protein ACI9TH_003616, partial [Kiritimatiellia bacterium]
FNHVSTRCQKLKKGNNETLAPARAACYENHP